MTKGRWIFRFGVWEEWEPLGFSGRGGRGVLGILRCVGGEYYLHANKRTMAGL